MISEKSIKNLAKKYEMNFETYVKELRICLSTQDLDNITFNKKRNSFIISKKQDNICVQFADFDVEEIDFKQAAINVIDDMNTSSRFYQNEANNSKIKMELAEQEKMEYMRKLEEFVNKKKDEEHELYSKFILILNEKKTRIQHLQEMLGKQKLNKKRGQTEDAINCIESKTKKEEISDSDTSVDEPVKHITYNVQIETSKKKLNFLDDEDTVTIKNLPKRVKTVSNPEEFENTMKPNEESNSKSHCEEITKSPVITETNKNGESQDSADFNTQDIFDRM